MADVKMPPLLHLFLFMSTALASSSSGGDTLTPKQSLADVNGDTLISANQSFQLGFFTPPNSGSRYVGIWYYNISIQTVVWVANRDNPITGHVGSLSLTTTGTLVVTDGKKTVLWSSIPGAQALSDPVAQLLDDGNFVVRESASSSDNSDGFAWQSFYHPTDTVLPGMKFGWNPKTGFRNLTAWKSISDPSPSEYVAAMDIRGYPEITLWAGARLIWRSGPWNGVRFSGVPEQTKVNMFMFIFVATPNENYYMIKMRDPSIRFRITVNQSGTSQGLVWIEQTQFWNLFWSAPKDQCDAAAPCGPYGVCDPNDWPVCSCLQGFEPKNPTNWELRDGTDGCVRKTPLDCTNTTDGFRIVSGAKLPDASQAFVELSLSLDACRAKCLSNCSCMAYASANISTGIGCILWPTDPVGIRVYTYGGQDLYIRQAAADLESKKTRWGITVAILACCVMGILILILCAFGLKRKKHRKRAMLENISFSVHSKDGNNDANDMDIPLFDLATIVEATCNFAPENKLGEGGFGPVYKGQLKDGQEIAVKRLAKGSVQGTDEFKNEVMLIAKLQHRNLVRLLGYCVHGEEKMLIYEFMHNNSLNIFLFDKTKSHQLDWKSRFNIILGVARGLVYLHQDSRFRVIHRDLKASNILLDKDMNPKISDFGLARIFGGDETEVNTMRVVGTYGYMSPEYAMDGIFSVKSDVFSFGVLILEVISGKRNRGVYVSERHENLLGLAWCLWQEGHGLDLIDGSIGDSYPLTEVLRCIKVGLLCVQERPEDRPIMSSVVFMLGSESSHLPQPKQPGFITSKGTFETDSSSSKLTSMSVNEISITLFEGR